MQGNETRPEIKPSATASLVLWFLDENGCEDTLDLACEEFEGESFDEIRPRVEAFAQEQWKRVAATLRKEFGK